MEDSAKFLNPWVLNFQKLGLELKCPLCLNLVNRPVLLPCNHVFCRCCVPGSTQIGADCPVCKSHFVNQDLRPLPFLENMAMIYKCLDATFSANFIRSSHSGTTDSLMVSSQNPASANKQVDNLRSGQSMDTKPWLKKNKKVKNDNVAIDGKEERFMIDTNLNLSSLVRRAPVCPEIESAPDSPPSFGDAARCSDNSSDNLLVHIPSRENTLSRVGKIRDESSGSQRDINSREVKRRKQLNYGQGKLEASNDDPIKAEVSYSGNSIPNLEPELQKVSEPKEMQTPKSLDDLLANQSVCAFCHTSKISEVTGPMLHYSNRKLVEGHDATVPGVIHVHKLCIDWSPKVFYVDDKVKNLTQEVARGAKLKCSKCGKKGAALGCFVTSCCRSYHVPCALGIPKCRWDHDEYLMLCPAHSSVQFPNEKSKSGKNIANRPVTPAFVRCQLPNHVVSNDGERKWVLCGSSLSMEEKSFLVKFGKMNGAAVSKFWTPNVTHVIAATDENGACTRTLKVLMAILNGRWVVKVDWIRACIEAKCQVEEEPYEVSIDTYGCRDSPKNGRLRLLNNGPKLFGGLNFHFVGDFLPSFKDDLEDLVLAGGGALIKSREELSALSCGEPMALISTPRALIVYNIDPPEGCKLGEEVSILWRRLSEAEDVASETQSKVIGHTWLLESIAAYKLQSLA